MTPRSAIEIAKDKLALYPDASVGDIENWARETGFPFVDLHRAVVQLRREAQVRLFKCCLILYG